MSTEMNENNLKTDKMQAKKSLGAVMKRNDWILIGVVLCIAAAICIFRFFVGAEPAGYVTVSINGETVKTYDLNADRIVELNDGSNIMQIKQGKVDMIEANCPDKLCVHQKAISKNNESIICLPNKVVLQIVSRDESELDAVTN